MPIQYDDRYIVKPGRQIQFTAHMLQELARCAGDITYFAEKYYTIIHPVRGEEVIKLYPFQREMLENMRINRQNLIMAARQLGKTTCASIYLLWFAIFNPSKTIAILANKQSTAVSIVDDIKKGWEMLPAWMKPGVKKYDQLEIKFENESRIFARATSPDAIRGEAVSLLFCDEFAFVPENIAEEFWVSNYPTLSTGGNIVVVSTPNGTAGKFYELWKSATSTKNTSWKTMKIPWFAHPERDEKWKETQIQAIGKVKFNQEYQCSFTGSSYTLIDGDILETFKAVDPPIFPEEGFYIWKKPQPNRLYLIGCDVAKGANTDFHVANVFDVTDWHTKGIYEQVAMFRRNDISVFEFKDKIIEIGKKYNNAPAIVENNNLGSVVVHNMYFEDGYDNTWYDYDKGEYGVNSNVKTKPLALTYFKEDVENKKMIINSGDMITELSYYEEVKTGVFQARAGRNFHDDTVASGYWVSYALRSKFWEDHLHYILSQKVQSAPLNDQQQDDEEIMKGFMKAFSGHTNADMDAEVQGFRNQLGQG